MSRPVSETLVASLREVLTKHPIVVWLDKDGHYTDLVDELIASEPEPPFELGAPLLGYRGSYLELMHELVPVTDGLDPKPLIVHVPGANQDSIVETPLLELNESGYQYRKALTTLVREAATARVPADEVDAFLAGQAESGDDALTLAGADAWMHECVSAATDKAHIVLRSYEPGPLIQALDSRGPVTDGLGDDPGEALDRYFGAQLGLPAAWPSAERRAWIRGRKGENLREYADLATRWALCVEYVHDLERAPEAPLLVEGGMRQLSAALVRACRATAVFLRGEATRPYYVRLADDIEDALGPELEHGDPNELGHVDTFRFEEERLLRAALQGLAGRDWALAASWAQQRLGGQSVWLAVDASRRKAWELVAMVARLGQTIAESKLRYADAETIDEATRRYAELGAPIDRLHREFEQQAASAFADLPHAELVRRAIDSARTVWTEWAEAGAREWTKLCETEGPLPDTSIQQRTIFAELVKPQLDEDRVVLVVVDGLRYEMAVQLVEMVGPQAATKIQLDARLAELPSITAVGMNALANVASSAHSVRMRPKLDSKRKKFEGFEVEGFALGSRKSRETAYGRAAGGVQWFKIAELAELETRSIRKRIAKARLVVVHSEAIDKAGEDGHGLLVFAQELRELVKAWEQLRQAGLRRFVISSDHGFLLRRPSDGSIAFGKQTDTGARHALYPGALDNDQLLGLSLRSLGYEGHDEALILPRGLDVFELARGRKFVHGGNSPQERVIPVLSIRHKRAAGGEDQHYRIRLLDQRLGAGANANVHTLAAEVTRADNQTTLALDLDPIALELRPFDAEGVVVEVLECRDAKLDAGLIRATVGTRFELDFRLSSRDEARVRVELVGASAKRRVDAAASTARFHALSPMTSGVFSRVSAVTKAKAPTKRANQPTPSPAPSPSPTTASTPTGTTPSSTDSAWLDEFSDPGVRQAMAYIDEHGSIREADLAQVLGSPRKARRFARQFDDYCKQVPFLMDQTHTDAGKVYRKISDK